METTVRVLQNVQFSVEARGHRLVCDQPRESAGDDGGMTPPELMLASLATCAAFYVVQYLKFNRMSSEGLEVRVEADKAMNPPRLGAFRILVDAPMATGERHVEGVRKAAEKCLIHNTLLYPPSMEIRVAAPAVV